MPLSRNIAGPRLPGVRFEVQAPPLAESLPRMDVAVFVGFAASGPVDQPVAVADGVQFDAIFGEDAPLATDVERGEVARGYLAPAVRSFFRNGGRRCWVVRVARGAQSNRFPLPALLARRSDLTVAPAFALARSEGSWSDAVRVSTSLQTRSVEVGAAAFDEMTFELAPSAPGDVRVGDLLRLNFRDEGYLLFFVVKEVKAGDGGARRARLSVRGGDALWCRTRWLSGSRFNPVSATAQAVAAGAEGPPFEVARWSFTEAGQRVTALLVSSAASAPRVGERVRLTFGGAELSFTVRTRIPDEPLASPPRETMRLVGRDLSWLLPEPDRVLTFPSPEQTVALTTLGRPRVEEGLVSLDLALTLSGAPAPGSVLRAEFGSEHLWLTVQEASALRLRDEATSTEVVRVKGQGFLVLPSAPTVLPEALPTGERLTFDLLVRQSENNPQRLGELGFAPGHPRYWGEWPTDARRFRTSEGRPFNAQDDAARAAAFFPLAGFNADVVGGGQSQANEIYVPLEMPFIDGDYLGAVARTSDALTRDGLAQFDASLFLDPKLVETNAESLMSEADFLRYQSQNPVSLVGIHAAMSVEEATLIAVPDAVHRGWVRQTSETVAPLPSPRMPHPEWWRFMDCRARQQAPTAIAPAWENFIDCRVRVVPAPELGLEEDSTAGAVVLIWTEVAGAEYVLEEAPNADWSGAAVVYRGAENRATLYGRTGGVYYYRVRAEVCHATSDWSDGVVVRLDQTSGWRVRAAKDYDAGTLLDVHRALLRMCAARGDLLAVLSLPEHYRENDAVTHAESLRPVARRTAPSSGSVRPRPLEEGEARALSYGALYHPWLTEQRTREARSATRVPPDGAACGVLAARALARGAWIAPANELLRGVVALTPPIDFGRRLDLQEARVNLVRQEPRGFVVLCADTLSTDPDLRPISVRRLLILLRRLALRLGSRYVFEPNDDAFRRATQRGFEAMLDHMFARGAFAGRTAATSYQVVTDETLNTPQSVEQGRFIVELKVAPSLPMTFLTVRLVQTNDRAFITEVR
ncbi:MAG: hypothetical protein QOH49_75 [Acidobacteriota bacterium]|jgi:hypothetical protein|nr:hypothetical protein [Acidobacteriota bacterium]